MKIKEQRDVIIGVLQSTYSLTGSSNDVAVSMKITGFCQKKKKITYKKKPTTNTRSPLRLLRTFKPCHQVQISTNL